jgi:hypothetical protein
MVDVFISYSRRDQEMVALLAHAIEAEGYDVWWDAELPPHQSYGDVITAKIAMAKAALVVWSDEAVKSEWVRAEADMARNQRKLIQTALNNVMPPLPFNQIQYAELGGWRGEADHPGWRKVKMSLADLCGPREPGTAGEGREAPRSPPPPPTPARETAQRQPSHPPAPSAAKWPLFAGIAIGAVALAAAGGVLLGQRGNAPAPSPPIASPAPAPAPTVSEVAPPPVVAENDDAAPVDDDVGPAEPAAVDMTFADSSTRLIAPSEIASLGPSTLKIARNEIYARKGRRFKDPWLREWFSRYAWYRPRYDEVQLNPIEQRNVALIRQAEARFGG